ncbi:MAG: MBL fold metallo-hydrolase [Desulfobacterales bacterium]|nr:MBL fold metallo-hydrolase [Desulfobacterales bacterium]
MKIQQIKLNTMGIFTYIIGDEESKQCVLIDPAFEAYKILNEVKKNGFKVIYVANTHYHGDHIAGNEEILRLTGAKLLIHKNDAKRMNDIMNFLFIKLLGGKKSPPPDILLKDGDELEIGSVKLKVIHTPGHTKGSICLYTEGNIFTGDTLFEGCIGKPGLSIKTLIKSIKEKIYSLPGDTIIWPGHNYGNRPYSTVEHEKINNPFTM